MIESREHFDSISDFANQDMTDGIWACDFCGQAAGENEGCRLCQIGLLKRTVEAMIPAVRAWMTEVKKIYEREVYRSGLVDFDQYLKNCHPELFELYQSDATWIIGDFE